MLAKAQELKTGKDWARGNKQNCNKLFKRRWEHEGPEGRDAQVRCNNNLATTETHAHSAYEGEIPGDANLINQTLPGNET